MCCNGFRIILMFSLAALSFVFNSFIPSIPVIVWYLVSINIFTFLLFIIDKYHSIKERKRVRELSLHFFSIAGGFIGAFLAMILVKHKLRKKVFLLWQSIISIIWIICIIYVINNLEIIQNTLQSLSK
ncbi:DUF1294 domain-containing protein [Sulfurospirillum arcachonense]|uniref:DUF1294 domain-containing protein n=1 Tax=Sulfurospirillum arcachonense TaxID=57666 RepID=UPI00046980A8|nr:DUF1294 domain-containing protein [Sulfurospirillum arcachonense]